jgi:hypothetical protein
MQLATELPAREAGKDMDVFVNHTVDNALRFSTLLAA